MPTCVNCGEEYRVGMLYCETCGERIEPGASTLHRIGEREVALAADRTLSNVPHSSDYRSILIYIRDAADLTPLVIPPGGRTVLGRVDRAFAFQPDIDLTVYGARKKGVSRIHAAIDHVQNRPTILDMGSTNGVAVNGELLAPGRPHYLCDSDVIHLGELEAHIYFE